MAKLPSVVHRDRVTGAETVLYSLEVDQPSDKVSFERADRLRTDRRGAFFQHRSREAFILVLESGRHTDPKDGRAFATYSIWKPSGSRVGYIREQELNEKYRVAPAHEARAWWDRQYDLVPPVETREVCIIGGAIISLWQKLKTKEDARLRVVRVSTEDGQRIVGVKIPRSQVRQVLRALGLDGPKSDPRQVFDELMQGGEPLTLVSGLSLKASTLQQERTVEVECHDPDRFQELRILGLINEQIRYKQHFFVPADEETGLPFSLNCLPVIPLCPTVPRNRKTLPRKA